MYVLTVYQYIETFYEVGMLHANHCVFIFSLNLIFESLFIISYILKHESYV